MHAAGGSVLVIVERRTVLGGPGAAVGGGLNENEAEAEDEDDGPAVVVRIEGVDGIEVERVGRLITLGTLAAKKLRGVDAENVSALAGFADAVRPNTASSANLPWLNPWRDNDTPSNSRPPSGASTRSQRDDRPASGSSTGSKRSTGGGYGAGGLVALPVNLVNRSVRDINRSQRRVRSREGRVPGGKHGEYWRSSSTGKPPAAAAAAAAATATTGAGDGTSGNAAGLGMAAIAAASAAAAASSSSEEDDYDH